MGEIQLQKIKFPGLNNTYTVPDPDNFAPSGYGLGEYTKRITNRNEIDGCGFWALSGQDSPLADYTWWGEVSSLEEKTMVFEVINVEGFKVRSIKRNYTWGEWEWVNPPMNLGVEYRTTERWNGKAVYIKAIDVGALPNNANKPVDGVVTGGCTGIVTVWARKVYANLSILPSYDGTYAWLNLVSTADLSQHTEIITLKYTKD